MSNARKTRSHPGRDEITVKYLAEETWRAAEASGDVDAYLNGLGFDGIGKAMRTEVVTRDEFLRRMAGGPALARHSSTAADPLVILMEPDALRQWWGSATAGPAGR
jgi:hypothetical protein